MALWRLLLALAVTVSLLGPYCLLSPQMHRARRTYQHSGGGTWEQNAWYRAMNWTAHGLNQTNCYVCSQMPQHMSHQPIFTPVGTNKSEMMCLFEESALVEIGGDIAGNMSKWFPNCSVTTGSWLNPTNFSQHTNTTLGRGIAPLRTNKLFPVCLTRNCTEEHNHSLPGEMLCSEVIDLRTPAITPPGFMWQCGGLLYWYLPWNWCGICTLVKLEPAIIVLTHLPQHTHRISRRGTDNLAPAIRKPKGIFMQLVPNYGIAVLRHQVNDLWFSLKNLTNAVLALEQQLEDDAELAAIKEMVLQNRMALDLLLANQGGVCEIIGDHCCTYIPDHKGNFSLIRQKLEDIKKNILTHQDTGLDFNLSSWFLSGSWRAILYRIAMIILAVLMLLCIITSCIIPCIRQMMTKMIATTFANYASVLQDDDPSLDDIFSLEQQDTSV